MEGHLYIQKDNVKWNLNYKIYINVLQFLYPIPTKYTACHLGSVNMLLYW